MPLDVQAPTIQEIGDYEIVSKIAEGGMGTVYKARHAMLRRPTAIKLLDVEKMSPSAVARFEREVQMTSALTHPNTVAVYDYGRTEDGTFYYVMEYLPGLSLQELVESYGPLPPGRAIHFLRQLCAALKEAHAIGLARLFARHLVALRDRLAPHVALAWHHRGSIN